MPFRLTANFIDAFGVSGVEGVFRSTCERAIRCMRSNRDLIMSELESLLSDPLMDWKTFHTEESSKGSDVFGQILKVIENRLRGVYGERMIVRRKGDSGNSTGRHTELSVQGQVDNVIKDATDSLNLARMYIGWMPFF